MSAPAPASASSLATDNATATPMADNPATSPYPIWNATAAYVTGTNIVWHGNVYQAKWWTQDVLPDAPVAQGASTPWTLLGPVLPGEKPSPSVVVPAGAYPQWSATTTYTAGARILFGGRIFVAKWWNHMESPEAALQGSTSSPWNMLTNAQEQALLAQK